MNTLLLVIFLLKQIRKWYATANNNNKIKKQKKLAIYMTTQLRNDKITSYIIIIISVT